MYGNKKNIKKMLKALNSDDPEKYMDSMKIYSRKIDPLGNKIKTGRTTCYVPQIQK